MLVLTLTAYSDRQTNRWLASVVVVNRHRFWNRTTFMWQFALMFLYLIGADGMEINEFVCA